MLWAMLASFAGCADAVGLDLEGWQYGPPAGGASGAPAGPSSPPDESGGGGEAGGGEAGGGEAGGGEAGGGEAGGGAPPALATSCEGMPDRRDGGCCAQVTTCAPGPGAFVCAPATRWDDLGLDYGELAGGIPFRYAEQYPICKDAESCLTGRLGLAMNEWQIATDMVRPFYQDFDQTAEHYLTIAAKKGACYAEGLDGPAPAVWLDPDIEGGCDRAAILHVLGHVLGLTHPHQRADRDRYLVVDEAAVPCGCDDDVRRACGPETPPAGPFDYRSIMTYPTAEPAAAFFTDKGGTPLPRVAAISPLDGPAVVERAAKVKGWQPFAALGHELGASTPLGSGLPGGRVVAGAPAAVLERPSPLALAPRLHLVVRSDDGHLYEKGGAAPWTSGPAPRPDFQATPWVDLGGEFASDAAAASPAEGRLDVVARRTDGLLYHRTLGAGDWAPIAHPPPGSKFAPALAAWSEGRLALVTVGADNRYWLLVYEGGAWASAWKGMASAAGFPEYPPAIASWGPGRLDLIDGRPNGGLAHSFYDPSCPERTGHWCGWTYLEQAVYAGPITLVASGPGTLELFYAGGDTVYQPMLRQLRYEGGQWGVPRSIGGIAPPSAAVAWPDATLTLYASYGVSAEGHVDGPLSLSLFERSWRPVPARAP